MTIQELRYFVEIANHRSFSGAAKKLFVTEATISHQISRLEKKLGFKLFERTNRKVEITPAGEQIYEKVHHIIEEYDELCTTVAGIARDMTNEISVGMAPVMNSIGLIDVFNRFSQEYPEVKTSLQVADEARLCTLLKDREIDFAVVKICDGAQDYFDPDIYEYVPLKEECLNVLMGASIAPEGCMELSLSQAVRYPVVLDKKDSYYYYMARKQCEKNHLSLTPYSIETNDLATIMLLIETNKAVCYASTSAADYYKKLYQVQAFKIVPEIHQYIAVLYLKNHTITNENKRLFRFLSEALAAV